MSPHAANSLVHDLVQMAKAMEDLPNVQQELVDVRSELDRAYATIQRLELKAIDRNNDIATLQAKVRDLEVQRDDAELRFLQADDAIQTVRRALGAVVAEAQGTLKAIEPPPVTSAEVGQSAEGEPTAPSVPTSPQTASSETVASQENAVPSQPASAEDQRVPSPTAPSGDGSGPSPVSAGPTLSAETSAGASSGQSEPNPTVSSSSGDQSLDVGEGASVNAASPIPQPASSTDDPEPAQKWSPAWWEWNDRRQQQAAQ